MCYNNYNRIIVSIRALENQGSFIFAKEAGYCHEFKSILLGGAWHSCLGFCVGFTNASLLPRGGRAEAKRRIFSFRGEVW